MLLRWILKLLGLGCLLGVGACCAQDKAWDSERMRRHRERAARHLHQLADAIAKADQSEPEHGA